MPAEVIQFAKDQEITEGGDSDTVIPSLTVDGEGGDSYVPDMIAERLAKLEGSVDTIKWAMALLAVVMVGGIAFLGFQVTRMDGKIDALPTRLAEEFRAMRAEMSAQTTAIANSITATRQQPPQVILMPAPQPPPASTKGK